ncbi:hypothetical protein PR048_028681 [Dryococelus australis]|uniref:Uncharacterized protein n=1 Tax=Dryococelus australis TaxID=614101 RepID=A0ABQ9GBX2_9NEOP|nr:hypothetical protein PR048_028681 [Dryococelus australis]
MPLVGWFSRISPVSPALAIRCCSIFTSFHPHWLSRPPNTAYILRTEVMIALEDFTWWQLQIDMKGQSYISGEILNWRRSPGGKTDRAVDPTPQHHILNPASQGPRDNSLGKTSWLVQTSVHVVSLQATTSPVAPLFRMAAAHSSAIHELTIIPLALAAAGGYVVSRSEVWDTSSTSQPRIASTCRHFHSRCHVMRKHISLSPGVFAKKSVNNRTSVAASATHVIRFSRSIDPAISWKTTNNLYLFVPNGIKLAAGIVKQIDKVNLDKISCKKYFYVSIASCSLYREYPRLAIKTLERSPPISTWKSTRISAAQPSRSVDKWYRARAVPVLTLPRAACIYSVASCVRELMRACGYVCERACVCENHLLSRRPLIIPENWGGTQVLRRAQRSLARELMHIHKVLVEFADVNQLSLATVVYNSFSLFEHRTGGLCAVDPCSVRGESRRNGGTERQMKAQMFAWSEGIEVGMDQRRNARADETGDVREIPMTRGIVRHDSYKRKSSGRPHRESNPGAYSKFRRVALRRGAGRPRPAETLFLITDLGGSSTRSEELYIYKLRVLEALGGILHAAAGGAAVRRPDERTAGRGQLSTPDESPSRGRSTTVSQPTKILVGSKTVFRVISSLASSDYRLSPLQAGRAFLSLRTVDNLDNVSLSVSVTTGNTKEETASEHNLKMCVMAERRRVKDGRVMPESHSPNAHDTTANSQ